MFVNSVKYTIRKFEKTGSLDVAQGSGRRATELAIVEEVPIAKAEAPANSSNKWSLNSTSIGVAIEILKARGH